MGLTDDPHPPIDAVHYPDILDGGGLAPAIERLARGLSLDLEGEVTPHRIRPFASVDIPSSRGSIHVSAEDGRRRFVLYLAAPLHAWAWGATAELSEVVGVVGLWRRGAPLRELRDRFPFMEYTRMAQAFEDGNDLEVQWEELLADPYQHRTRPLMLAAHASPWLSRWHPSVSHATLARFMSRYLDKSADQVFIEMRRDDRYEVSSSWGDERRTVTSVGEAVAAAEEMMAARSPAS
jgi:hypothetical protein